MDQLWKIYQLELFFQQKMQVVWAEEGQLFHLLIGQQQMTWWVCLMDLLAHIIAQHVCTSQLVLLSMSPSTVDLQIPVLFLHSINAMPVDFNIHRKSEI